MNSDYVSLHNHSTYSIMHSLIKPSELFKRAKELGQSAIAVTDLGSLAGAWDCLKYSKEAGVKLIIGCEFYFAEDLTNTNERLRHIILLAKNQKGYRNLLALSKIGYDNNIVMFKKVIPRIDWNLLEKYSEDLICTTACGSGILSQLINTRKVDEAKKQAARLKGIFGSSLALEIQPHKMRRIANVYRDYQDQVFTNNQLVKIGRELDIKVVVATDAHYLTPDQHDAHDVMLAIGSGQPIKSGNRLKYTNDFHVKSRDEIIEHLRPVYKADAEVFCDNTLFFSEMCEEPDWIDPKYSNPNGKELPQFPVKNQSDYSEFKQWQAQYDSENKYAEDAAYLRYWCDREFDKRFPYLTDDSKIDYKKRLEEEFDVIEYHGFSSYMLIVADYIDYCRKNNISVGNGRGCLSGSTLVLTSTGFQNLKDLSVGDKVFTHTGKCKEVLDVFKFNVSKESLVKVKTDHSFGTILMTKDHKVYASKAKETDKYINLKKNNSVYLNKVKRWEDPVPPQWIPIGELKKNDLIYTTIPQRKIKNSWEPLDLSLYCDSSYCILPKKIKYDLPLENVFSINRIRANTGLSKNFLRDLKKNGMLKLDKIGRTPTRHLRAVNCLQQYLQSNGSSIKKWVNKSNVETRIIKRFIPFDNMFLYVLGRWVGDGWFRSNKNTTLYNIGIAFHSDDKSITSIKEYFLSFGFEVSIYKHKTKKLNQLMIHGKLIYNMFKKIFSHYKCTSGTKHLPLFFRQLSNESLTSLITGVLDSDGHKDDRQNIDTTSLRLLLELKESLLYLGVATSVSVRKPFYSGKYLCKKSYKLRYQKNGIENKNQHGYFSKILSIKSAKTKFVYDINVKTDHSYLTSNYVVHNSVGGSVIGFLTGIHQADPVKYGLIFARFHNKEKTSFPDIDTDFESAGKEIVQTYIRKKYGEDHVAHVSNINTMTPKVYARSISRVFQYGGDPKAAVAVGNALADSIPKDVKTVEEALSGEAPLFDTFANDKKYEHLKLYAKDLGSKATAWSTHAGGIVIGSRPLVDIVPLRRDKEGSVVLEYDKDKVELNGLVKMDILGVSTLDIIKNAYRLIKEVGKVPPTLPLNYDENDEDTYKLICRGNTFCVFQLGTSGGTIDLCRKIQPRCIEDLAVINTLARPAAKDIRKPFIEAKESGKEVELMHESLKRAFSSTFGFPIYEECLMYLGQDVAGWDLHQADRLRKLTKDKGKNPEKVAKWRLEFISDAQKNRGLTEEIATKIWDEIISKFGGYAFNKSHAIFYSFLGYETAYLKTHFPLEFLTANLQAESQSNALDSKENIIKIKNEIRHLKVNIVPPDINSSETTYKIIDGQTLLTGLDSLKYMGKDAIPEILANRPFTSFEDFLSRVDGKKVRAPAVQALAASGCLDSFGMTRKEMFLYASDYKKKLQVWLKKKNKTASFNYPWPNDKEEWTIAERYALERYYIGEGLSGDKFNAYPGFFNKSAARFAKFPEIFPNSGNSNDHFPLSVFQAEVMGFFEFKVKKEDSKSFGKKMAKVTLEDPWGSTIMMTVFAKQWADLKNRLSSLTGGQVKELVPGVAIFGSGHLNWYEGELSIVFDDLLKCVPPPPLPTDLKAKKVSMRTVRASKKVDEQDAQELLEEIEDELVEDGFSFLEDEEEELEDDIFKNGFN